MALLARAVALKKAIESVAASKASSCLGFNIHSNEVDEYHMIKEEEKEQRELPLTEQPLPSWNKRLFTVATDQLLEEDEGDDKGVMNHDDKIIPCTGKHYQEIEETLARCRLAAECLGLCEFTLPINQFNESVSFAGLSLPIQDSQEEKKQEAALRKLYETLPKGVYGDMKSMETKCDESVRLARDLTADQFTVKPELLARLKKEWQKAKMVPQDVEIRPYKINFYPQGGKFAPHKDTPSNGFIGTIVMSLFDTSDAKFLVGGKSVNIRKRWSGFDCAAFYGDIVHELKPITNDGLRVTATFSIFAAASASSASTGSGSNKRSSKRADNAAALHELNIRRRLADVKKELKVLTDKYHGFGILSQYQYSQEAIPSGLKGEDLFLKTALESLALPKFADVCVVEKYHRLRYFNDENSDADNAVYLCREEDVAAIMENNPALRGDVSAFQNHDPNEPLRFFRASADSPFIWKNQHDEGAVNAGNESRPEEQSSVYIHRAFLIPSTK